MRWTELPLAFLDLEMTGRDPKRDRICEIAIHRVVDGATRGTLSSLVDAGVDLDASTKIHGIGREMLEGAPRLIELRERVSTLLEGAILIGHGLDFDRAFLRAAAERNELEPLPAAMRVLDTRKLARRALRAGSTALDALAQDLSLPLPTHRAESDVLTTRALFAHLVTVLRPSSLEDLDIAQDLEGPARMRGDVRHVLSSAQLECRAVTVCYRVPGRPEFTDQLVDFELQGNHVIGWLATRRERRTLRGDRILWVRMHPD